MKRIAAALLAAFALAAPASAATLYVGHGIDGRDLGLSQDLPVDICLVSGPAALGLTYPVALFENVPFKAFAKIDIDLPAGQYGVEVQLVSAAGPTRSWRVPGTGILRIQAPTFLLTVTATDAAGNVTTVQVAPVFGPAGGR